MKKVEQMRAEYRREGLGKGVRGKHYADFKKGNTLGPVNNHPNQI